MQQQGQATSCAAVTQLWLCRLCRRLTVLLGGHPRALGRGCLLAALPAPLLADITRSAVELNTCRIEIDMTVGLPLPVAAGAH